MDEVDEVDDESKVAARSIHSFKRTPTYPGAYPEVWDVFHEYLGKFLEFKFPPVPFFLEIHRLIRGCFSPLSC